MTLLRNVISIVALPTVVTIGIPYWIVSSRSASEGTSRAGGADVAALLVGIAVIAAGFALVAVTVWQFATIGRGTLAPWDPPRRLVVAGVYRHLRNPMISGVLAILLGEALIFRSSGVLVWALAFLAINATYIPLVEERGLARRFGADYLEYRRHVPRWVPRLRPWCPSHGTGRDGGARGDAGPATD